MTEKDVQAPVPLEALDQIAEPSPEQEFEVYAWVRLARFLDIRREAYNNTKGPVRYIDLCSSFPLYPEILRSRHAAVLYHEVNSVLPELRNNLRLLPHVKTLGATDPADTSTYPQRQHFAQRLLRRSVGNEDPSVLVEHQLLSLAFDALNEFPETEQELKQPQKLALLGESILTRMRTDKSVTIPVRPEKGETDIEARWNIKSKRVEAKWTFSEMLTNFIMPQERAQQGARDFSRTLMPVEWMGEERAELIMTDLANWFAQRLAPHARSYRAFSVDSAPQELLLSAAEQGFDAEILQSDMYRRAREMKDHTQADLLEYVASQPDNSVTFYTSFEGFPIYFGSSEQDQDDTPKLDYMKDVLGHMFRSLQQGGIALLFPWQILPETKENESMIRELTLHLKRLGAEVDERLYHREEILHWMTDKEREIAEDKSPILKSGDELITMLKFSKPHSRAYVDWIMKAALYPQDPTE